MIEKLVQEFKEHDVMLERGLKFDLQYKRRIKVPFLPVFLPVKATKTIYHQPTLSTLSAMGREFLLFEIQDEIELNKPFTETGILADKTAEKMSRVIATMAIGITDPAFKSIEVQDSEITALANIIYYNVKPILLHQIVKAFGCLQV